MPTSNITRRHLIQSAVTCFLVPDYENHDTIPTSSEMINATAKLAEIKNDIRNTIIILGLQEVSPQNLNLLRQDAATIKAMFPELNEEERARIKQLIPFTESDGVAVHNTQGVLTAYRKNARTRVWMNAGYCTPPGMIMDEKTAFARDNDKPWEHEKISGFSI